MKVNPGYILSKLLRVINRPALRNCNIHKSSKVGTGSNCIDVSMGRYSYMGKNNSVCNADIGAFCSIASYCAIGGGSHSVDAVSTSPVFAEGRNILRKNLATLPTAEQKRVTIGNDVWIGEAAFICGGVTIGNGAIIGAHSVVTHDVPDYAVVAGAPARVIRYRFTQSQIQALLQLKWWEMPDDMLAEKSQFFGNVDTLLAETRGMK